MSRMISPHVVPANAGTHNHRRSFLRKSSTEGRPKSRGRSVWVPAFAGTTAESAPLPRSNLAVDVPLHPVSHLDPTPPGPLQERHHAIHVAVARQRDFDLALALGYLRLALLQRIRFRQRLFDLAGHGGLTLGELGLEPFIVGLQPDNVGLQTADLRVHRRAFV